ncbi:MAG: type IV pilus twitching motility protein PilT [Turicibacter sanguinis]|uniref:type IV pilus twitching motility protein PilT n=1 Tax=Turicibacter sanguinis TaxID=154288 RepID=UPI0006BF74E8|nr:type IV pilus twitching motility protein PilT [Turicibacter sanguinis]MCU7195395.1 type IV pilus twitching motility protein PilT [Turicibacter sanguinis]MCU7203015.1 type IV pilus twitching motility protein PilT [Turicibacter sanguinis]MDB8436481.1 type IV pilus twitching motility protein PilT [Turicibacter sanguinis]MDB8563869.1 type IV pilus twitching motility protein PilT [Turicibacter sanguinis]MDB8567133.1 type IV pilus twitching motility protein PilT [Turicibacter sanguinis]
MQSINEILTEAITLKASDIHITVGVPVMIRLRGELCPLNDDVLTSSIVTALVHEIIPQDHFESFQENYQLDFSHSIPGVSRFRVNAYYQRGQMALAIRPIPNKIPTFEELELPPILKAFMDKPRGLVLVTGPTGSGKSTTLAAMINYVNQNAHKHIITLEDPIEFQHKHNKCVINQREIGSDVKDFNSALRVALRQDPDIILVGEMRDLETIQIALTAAETGHLVIGTLHTSSAASTIERIIDVFPAEKQTQIRMQLAGSLVGVVAQRLFKRQDSDGRKAVCEIMVNTPAIANLIRQEKVYQIPSVIQTSKEMGMQTMEMAIKEQMMYGVIGMEDAKAYLE